MWRCCATASNAWATVSGPSAPASTVKKPSSRLADDEPGRPPASARRPDGRAAARRTVTAAPAGSEPVDSFTAPTVRPPTAEYPAQN